MKISNEQVKAIASDLAARIQEIDKEMIFLDPDIDIQGYFELRLHSTIKNMLQTIDFTCNCTTCHCNDPQTENFEGLPVSSKL